MDLSVITATWNRPQLLALCLSQFRRQNIGHLTCEHIVISDGPDSRARATANHFGARYLELEEHRGGWGAACNDAGIETAQGDCVVFWNDDNLYHPHALVSLYAAAQGVDIGVCSAGHWSGDRRVDIAKEWHGAFNYGDIDAMCVCVRHKLAATEKWAVEPVPYECDFQWLRRLEQHSIVVRHSPVEIGEHL